MPARPPACASNATDPARLAYCEILQIGGSTTVPRLQVDKIEVIG
jgi:hypothetical protein